MRPRRLPPGSCLHTQTRRADESSAAQSPEAWLSWLVVVGVPAVGAAQVVLEAVARLVVGGQQRVVGRPVALAAARSRARPARPARSRRSAGRRTAPQSGASPASCTPRGDPGRPLLRQATSAAHMNNARVVRSASGRETSIHQWMELPSWDPGGWEAANPSSGAPLASDSYLESGIAGLTWLRKYYCSCRIARFLAIFAIFGDLLAISCDLLAISGDLWRSSRSLGDLARSARSAADFGDGES